MNPGSVTEEKDILLTEGCSPYGNTNPEETQNMVAPPMFGATKDPVVETFVASTFPFITAITDCP